MKEHQVLFQIKQLPDNLKQEVLDFIAFLFSKYQLISSKPIDSNTPNNLSKSKPVFGCGTYKIKIAKDFDAPIEDFKE